MNKTKYRINHLGGGCGGSECTDLLSHAASDPSSLGISVDLGPFGGLAFILIFLVEKNPHFLPLRRMWQHSCIHMFSCDIKHN